MRARGVARIHRKLSSDRHGRETARVHFNDDSPIDRAYYYPADAPTTRVAAVSRFELRSC